MSIEKIYQKVTWCLLRALSLCISATLGVLCSCHDVMYGCPHADFMVSGTILSLDQNLPIEGLSVIIKYVDTLYTSRIIDSAQTDSDGRYSLQFSECTSDNTWDLQVKDIDSIANGFFNTKDTIISISESELQDPSGTWYQGHAEKTVDLKIDRNK